MKFFETRKAAYEAFVERRAGRLRNSRCLAAARVLPPADNGASFNSGFYY